MYRNVAMLMECYGLTHESCQSFDLVQRAWRTCEPLSNLSQPFNILLVLLVGGLEIPLAVLALAMRSEKKNMA